MIRRTLIVVPVLAAGLLLALAASIRPGTPAVAQDSAGGRAESGDRLIAEGMTREELVSLYALLAGPSSEPPACVEGDEMFDDVPASHLFCAWIEELARRGITQGCDDNNYCPGNPVTRGQMAPFIVRATPAVKVVPFHVILGVGGTQDVASVGSLTLTVECRQGDLDGDDDGDDTRVYFVVRSITNGWTVNWVDDVLTATDVYEEWDAGVFDGSTDYRANSIPGLGARDADGNHLGVDDYHGFNAVYHPDGLCVADGVAFVNPAS